jgi:hypothetical protein
MPKTYAGNSPYNKLIVIENGIFTRGNGYPCGYVSRLQPGFSNDVMTYLLPSLALGRTGVDSLDLLYALT